MHDDYEVEPPAKFITMNLGSTSISVKTCLYAFGISGQYSQPEVSHVTVAISHPLYGLNPIILTLDKSIGYPVVEVVQNLVSPS